MGYPGILRFKDGTEIDEILCLRHAAYRNEIIYYHRYGVGDI
jgi:hypothetical protein